MRKAVLLFILLKFSPIEAQCGPVPPPLGMSLVYSIDLDNDGFTVFDISYYITNVSRPVMEQIHGVSSAGYDFVFYNYNNVSSPLIYTNMVAEEVCWIHYEYSGTGPTFDPVPPCFYPPFPGGYIQLVAVPFDGDEDNDGIINVDEDSNNDLNLMNDDTDGDGILNFLDPSILSIDEQTVRGINVYPNPVTTDLVYLDSPFEISHVSIYDQFGKQIKIVERPGSSLSLSHFATGIYFLRIETIHFTTTRKIQIE